MIRIPRVEKIRTPTASWIWPLLLSIQPRDDQRDVIDSRRSKRNEGFSDM